MNTNKCEEIFSVLSKVKLKGIGNINVGEALCTIIFGEKESIYSRRNLLKELISVLFFRNYTFEYGEKSNILLVLSPSYGERIMCKEDFMKVRKCVKHHISVMSNHRFKINVCRLKLLVYWIDWMNSLKKLNIDLSKRFHYCNQLLLGFTISNEICDKISKEEIKLKLAVTYCDVHVVDYFLTYYFNKRSVNTATLQHALFSSSCDTGWHCKFSHSKFFLAISKYAADEAKKAGVPKERIIITGPLKYIGVKREINRTMDRRDLIGVALSGPVYECQNEQLLEHAKKIADNYNYKIVLRSHPAINIDKYEDYINKEMVKISGEKETMSEFAEQCDFVIMGTTNVFADLISIGCPAYRLVKDTDFFSNIYFFKFENYHQLNVEVNQFVNNRQAVGKKITEISEYLCPTNIEQNYMDFFDNYI